MRFLLQQLQASVDRSLSATPQLPLDYRSSTQVHPQVITMYNTAAQFRGSSGEYMDTSVGPLVEHKGLLL